MVRPSIYLSRGLSLGFSLFLSGSVSNMNMQKSKTDNPKPLNSNHPNILIINIDDMGYGDLSCTGNPAFKTPNIDKIYNQSIRFPQFHSAPMSTPSRGQLLTGVDALRNGARQVGTENTNLRTDMPTMGEIFHNAGYRTAIFGKWHIGDNYPMRPEDRGYEEVVSYPQQEIGTVNDFWGNDYFDDVLRHNGKPQKYNGFCTDVWFNLAMDWMTKCSSKNEPFLCYLPTNVVHGPYYAKQIDRERIGIEQPLKKEIETYFAMLRNLDDNIGQILEFLDQKGLRSNTILIFMSDNGATGGYQIYNAGMKGLKAHLFDGGHRVPCFVSWPNGNLRAPGDILGLAEMQDILPTLLDLSGIDKPLNTSFDGISLAKQLRGQAEMPDRMLVVQMQRTSRIKKFDACVLWGPWRLLNAFDIEPEDTPDRVALVQSYRKRNEAVLELYNIEKDPHQDVNVMEKYPEIVSKMKEFYDNWWDVTEPQLSIPRPAIIGNNAENPMMLSAPSWAETYLTQRNDILQGRKANGTWNILVDKKGTYEFALCRWPKEAKTHLTGGLTIKLHDTYVFGNELVGKAIPIKEARIQIAGYNLKIPVKSDDYSAKFTLKLEKGPAKLKTWFYDETGQELCGAYYVYVKRK